MAWYDLPEITWPDISLPSIPEITWPTLPSIQDIPTIITQAITPTIPTIQPPAWVTPWLEQIPAVEDIPTIITEALTPDIPWPDITIPEEIVLPPFEPFKFLTDPWGALVKEPIIDPITELLEGAGVDVPDVTIVWPEIILPEFPGWPEMPEFPGWPELPGWPEAPDWDLDWLTSGIERFARGVATRGAIVLVVLGGFLIWRWTKK